MPPTDQTLSDYETRIAAEIAAWKARPQSLFGRFSSRITRPFAWTLGRVIPQSAAKAAISAAYTSSGWLTSSKDVLQHAGVSSFDELREKPLEFCDGLAGRIGLGSQTVAFVDGAVTGAGGFLLAAADVGALAIVALRAIHLTGHCYGFPLDQPGDRAYVLGVLMLAGTKSQVERLELLGRLASVQQWALSETVEAVALEGLAAQFVRLASLEAVPGIGAVIGSITNVAFIRHVLETARRVFQERWLRERGKVDRVPPAPGEMKRK